MDWAFAGSLGPGALTHSLLKACYLEQSTSRRGNCHDNAFTESVFDTLTRERIRHRTYRAHQESRRDVFRCFEVFYNPNRKHTRNGMPSPVKPERQPKPREEGAKETRVFRVETIERARALRIAARQ